MQKNCECLTKALEPIIFVLLSFFRPSSNSIYFLLRFPCLIMSFSFKCSIVLYTLSSLAKDCGFIGTPRNGTKRGSQTTYPGIVIFSCDDGFIMRGSAERQCSANGSWSGVETNCEGKILLKELRKEFVKFYY